MMRSASRRALEELKSAQDQAFGGHTGTNQLADLASELYAVADVLVGAPQLRRTLGDPATAPEKRTGLVDTLFAGKVGDSTLTLVKTAVGQRWSSPWDLTDALETAGDDALFASADKAGELDRVEDELFRLERILAAEGDVASLLDEQTASVERRSGLLDTLVEGKVAPVTLSLLRHAVASQRKRSVLLAIDDLLEQAAARQHRSIARVVSARPLTAEQERRLAAVLTEMYGRAISVRSALDPDLQGGLVVRVGDEVIDGSVATRFAQARAAMGA
jgi:F-type H+-transporting ATPase subunit delta